MSGSDMGNDEAPQVLRLAVSDNAGGGDTKPAPADSSAALPAPGSGAQEQPGLPELDDLAAELDDPPTSNVAGSLGDADDADAGMFSGVCHGGPYDGRSMVSRFPKGFFLVDQVGNQAWVYDYIDGLFTCRTGAAPESLDSVDRWREADEPSYDIVAYDAQQPLP